MGHIHIIVMLSFNNPINITTTSSTVIMIDGGVIVNNNVIPNANIMHIYGIINAIYINGITIIHTNGDIMVDDVSIGSNITITTQANVCIKTDGDIIMTTSDTHMLTVGNIRFPSDHTITITGKGVVLMGVNG